MHVVVGVEKVHHIGRVQPVIWIRCGVSQATADLLARLDHDDVNGTVRRAGEVNPKRRARIATAYDGNAFHR
jgi:hypothetical protein